MISGNKIFEKTLIHYLYSEFKVSYRFKYILPKVREITLEGIKLDVSELSPKVRNRLLSGSYEANEKEMCREFLAPSDSVLEMGGAIGFIGLFCMKHIGIKDYACFEANPRTCHILRRNYALNGLEPRVWNIALAHADGSVDLEIGGDFWGNSLCFKSDRNNGSKTIRVPAGALQTLFQLSGSQANVLIIDIEGAEQFIDMNQIPERVNKMIIELHPGVIGQELTYNIVANFIGAGFRVAREQEDTFVFLRK